MLLQTHSLTQDATPCAAPQAAKRLLYLEDRESKPKDDLDGFVHFTAE